MNFQLAESRFAILVRGLGISHLLGTQRHSSFTLISVVCQLHFHFHHIFSLLHHHFHFHQLTLILGHRGHSSSWFAFRLSSFRCSLLTQVLVKLIVFATVDPLSYHGAVAACFLQSDTSPGKNMIMINWSTLWCSCNVFSRIFIIPWGNGKSSG